MFYIKPKPGLAIADPDHGGLLPEVGRWVESHQYWLRRLEDGDVVLADPPADAVDGKTKESK